MNEASDSRARGAARGAIARRRGSQKGRACPLRSRAPGENATRGAGSGGGARPAPARRGHRPLDARVTTGLPDRRVCFPPCPREIRGMWLGLAVRVSSVVAAGRARSAGSYTLYRDNGPVYPLSYRTDRSAARHKVTHDAAVPRHAAAPPRRRARKLITIKNCLRINIKVKADKRPGVADVTEITGTHKENQPRLGFEWAHFD